MAGTYTNLLYHIVFSTKNRTPLITVSVEEELHSYIGGIIRGIEGICLEISGMPDHIHILAKLPPKIAISNALRDIKANSSKWMCESKTEPTKFGWQDGYSAFTVSKSQVDHVRKYIREQKLHLQRADFQSELRALLGRHEIDYDEAYIWG
jgi:REP element-mobilizing transposase RayT